jgi:sugar phosphate isomerase/epimerase
MNQHRNAYPKLHNAMWPGLVGKGSPGAEPCLDLDTMLNLTAAAEVDGVKFDGVDIFLYDPHIPIDATDDELKRIADKIQAKGLVVGSVVAPIWGGTGGGSAMGDVEDRKKFVGQVHKACRITSRFRDWGLRSYGIIRIDSACSVDDWAKDPKGNTDRIAVTFREACDVAESFGERLAAEGEICWGGMHSWKEMVRLLERVNRPKTLGFQADMAHTLLYTLGYNAPEAAILPPDWNWSDPARLDKALQTLTATLRPWTIDLHIAQNDATVKGSGDHDKTGRHCLADDPHGKLDIARHAGYWLRDQKGKLTRAVQHVCWDGCMFPNEVMMKPETWNTILAAMVAVRDAHGWTETKAQTPAPASAIALKKSAAAKRKSAPKTKTAKPAKKVKPMGKVQAGKSASQKVKKLNTQKALKKAVKAPAKKPAKTPGKKKAAK